MILSKFNLDVTCFLIVGLPGESVDTIDETIAFVKELQRTKYILYDDVGVLMVYPGTEIYDMCVERGCLTDQYWLSNKTTPYYECENDLAYLFDLKKRLLKHIALSHFFSSIAAQYDMIPYIWKYFCSRGIPSRLSLGLLMLKPFGKIYNALFRFAKFLRRRVIF